MKKISMADVAREAGCSKATVSYSISRNRPIAEETRRRVFAAIEKLGYRPFCHRKARHKMNIAVLLPFLCPGITPYPDYLAEEIYASGYIPQFHPLPPDFERIRKTIGNIGRERSVAGILSLVPGLESIDILKWSGGIPSIISIRDNCMLSPIRFNFRHSARLAIDHLGGLGHRRLLYLTEKESFERLPIQAYRQEFRQFEEADEGHAVRILQHPKRQENPDFRPLVRLLDAALRDGFRAIVTQNNFFAAAAYEWAASRGLSIPKDFSVVSLENTVVSDWMIPKLTRVRMPDRAIAEFTAKALLDTIAGVETTPEVFYPVFHAGASTAPPPESCGAGETPCSGDGRT